MDSLRRFPYPFCYVPSEDIKNAAQALISKIDADCRLRKIFGEGKMLGVMICEKDGQRHILHAFSGLAGGSSTIDGFVPPILEWDKTDGYFRKKEAEISRMENGPAKSLESERLQSWLFDNYIVHNASGQTLSIREIFSLRGLVPPGGTGECAAPKLLEYAFRNGMTALEMGEFWYGDSHQSEVREQGRFYPACMGKCGPLLTWMMQGMDVEDNPLDKEFTADREPSVIYYDDHIIVADKPSGMLSVPGRTRAVSLLSWLQERYGEVHSCHRLDMDTSGIMVFARTAEDKVRMELQFASHKVSKTYHARLCSGTSPFRKSRKGTIALPLSPDYYDRPRQIVDTENGKTAVTGYEVLEVLPNGEIDVLFTPLTGRTHQLRVHAAHSSGLGRPIKGDRLYGDASSSKLWLTATSISFQHPDTGEPLSFRLDH